ncbi:DUF1343 domain-containing protein [Aurantibacter crassamenti]|uniref:exo-beta-N-acetylmuramidase NamZ family protein n=1 Tax=Aurantibacter crassamenti TaxID=1837375 RepID=UPI00193A8648|nr:DUF1343 domain-containing protein [Aurantibacter crassamenti]MBM1106176.1 DUF1343 domain-containing protein [Aurantibacter crassamenti]
MPVFSNFKNTVLLWVLIPIIIVSSCGNQSKTQNTKTDSVKVKSELTQSRIIVGANNLNAYLPQLKGQRVAIVANQTSVIFNKNSQYTHLVDSLLAHHVNIKKVFAPEHGFRGAADAGEHVKDGIDAKTGLPIISLYGKNRKPTPSQLANVDVVIFDIQDVGVRFYTYIATLQLVMEACAESKRKIIVLDRPNPNGHYIDGPSMETENQGFLGMTNIPLVYGMTIGEYANMLNGEGWLSGSKHVNLTIVPLDKYNHLSEYEAPIRPSPNLPNATAINLYPSLGLFEGTNINAGRGTEFQFQRYGASFLDKSQYSFVYFPKPNFGSKTPKENGKKCYGKDLSKTPRISEVSLKWIIDAYANCTDKSLFFNTSGFTKHAGTELLQKQIEDGLSEDEIKATWQEDLEAFKLIREKYLLYD